MVKWGCSYHSRTNGRNYPSKPWEIELFSCLCPYFSTCSSLKSSAPIPINILFLKLTRIDLLPHEVCSLEVENCGLRKHLKLDDF